MPASANQYQFAFTASQVLSALRSSQGFLTEQSSAYYGVWVTPNVASFSYQAVSGLSPAPTDVWQANTINDPSDLGGSTATWAEYAKLTTGNVSILSDANNGGGPANNIFLNHNYTGSSSPPVPFGWGPQTQTMTSVLASNTTFQFIIDTPDTLSGSVSLSGRASGLISGATNSMTGGTKDFSGLTFNLNVTAQPIPEPAEWTLLFGGLAGLILARKFRPRPAPGRADVSEKQ